MEIEYLNAPSPMDYRMASPPIDYLPASPPCCNFCDLNDDVLLVMFDHLKDLKKGIEGTPLKSLSLVNRRLRILLLPLIFQNTTIVSLKSRPQLRRNGDWKAVRRAISTLSSNSAILKQIRALRFDIYGPHIPNTDPPALDMFRLVTFLAKLPHLQSLILYIPPKVVGSLSSTFCFPGTANSPLILPGIKSLVIHPCSLFLLDLCPNVEALALHSPHLSVLSNLHTMSPPAITALKADITSSLSRANSITYLDLSGSWAAAFYTDHHGQSSADNWWAVPGNQRHNLRPCPGIGTLSASFLLDLASVAPQIQRINLDNRWGYEDPLPAMLSALSQFKHLRRLELAAHTRLGMMRSPEAQFNNVSWRDACIGYRAEGLGDLQDWYCLGPRQAEELIAEWAFETLPALEMLWLGTQKLAVRVETDGWKMWKWEALQPSRCDLEK